MLELEFVVMELLGSEHPASPVLQGSGSLLEV